MSPLSRPRRRRVLLMNESPPGNESTEPAPSEESSPSIAPAAATMPQLFLEDCGVPEGFDVHVSVQGRPDAHTVHVDEAFTFLGRDEECGVRLAGADIGRHHAYLQAIAGQFVVVDLGSRTGIRQNGRAVRTALLSSGGTVEVGPYTIRISRSAGADFHELPTEQEIHRSNPPIALAFINQAKPVDPWTLDTPVTLIGSAKPCRVRLEHSTVAPQHCAIVRGFTRWWIVDLNSHGGTIVNDEPPLPCRPLKIGSQLQVGRYRIEIRKPRPAESVIQPPVIDGEPVNRHAPAAVTQLMDILPTTPLSASGSGGPQGVNEHLVLELFREFAALHERTVTQMQQSFREMLEVATANRTPLIAPQPEPVAAPPAVEPAPPAAEAEPAAADEPETTLNELIHSEDPEERQAAQDILAAQMRSLDAKLRGEREGIAKRLLRSLSLTK